MAKEFSISREGERPGTPEEVWDAITTGSGGWLWPMDFEPRVGGTTQFGTITAWEPGHHLIARAEGEGGWYNQVEHVIEARDGTTWFRYVHSGMFTDDWDNQYDGASKHTDFYLHTLAEYLRHFTGERATYASVDGPPVSTGADAFVTLAHHLGLTDAAEQGATVRVSLPGLAPTEAVLDYRNEWFIGLRTDEAMFRFFGRNAFGAPVGIAVHHFGAVDQQQLEKSSQAWLDGVYA